MFLFIPSIHVLSKHVSGGVWVGSFLYLSKEHVFFHHIKCCSLTNKNNIHTTAFLLCTVYWTNNNNNHIIWFNVGLVGCRFESFLSTKKSIYCCCCYLKTIFDAALKKFWFIGLDIIRNYVSIWKSFGF